MKPTGPIRPSRPSRPSQAKPKRQKPPRVLPPRTPAEVGRRASQAHAGRQFVYAAKGNARAADRAQQAAVRREIAVPSSSRTQRALGKMGHARRRRNAKMRSIWRTLGLAAGLAAAIYGIIYLTTNPAFTIASVEVNGIPEPDASNLQASIGNTAIGRNLFVYWLTEHRRVTSQIVSSQTDLQRASMRLRLPHTLAIDIVERQPCLLISFGPGGMSGSWMLDSSGIPIRDAFSPRWNDRPATLMPVNVDARLCSPSDLSLIRLGQPLPPAIQDVVNNAFAVEQAVRVSPIASQVASIHVDNSGYLGLNMESHLLIKLGDIGSLDRKLALASALMSQRMDLVATARYIDVTDPDWPAVMPLSPSDGSTSVLSSAEIAVPGNPAAQNAIPQDSSQQ